MTQAIQKTLRDSAAMRWTALLLLALAMFCSYIFMDILSPIKDLMQETRGWDSTAFGTMQGSEVFLNVFVFFLIFAGIILDKMGVRFTEFSDMQMRSDQLTGYIHTCQGRFGCQPQTSIPSDSSLRCTNLEQPRQT